MAVAARLPGPPAPCHGSTDTATVAAALGTVLTVADWRDDRIGSALRGENPTVLARLPGGFAVMGDPQWLPGYCLLLTDQPDVERLSELSRSERSDFLHSMADLGEAVERACRASDSAFRRVNIEILGNADRYLHAHIWPRYGWEDAQLIARPVWLYPVEKWRDPQTLLGLQHSALRAAITSELRAGGAADARDGGHRGDGG